MLRIIVVQALDWLAFENFVKQYKESRNDSYARIAGIIYKSIHVYNMKKYFKANGNVACTLHFYENEQNQLLDMLKEYHESSPQSLDFYGLTTFQPYENFVFIIEKPFS